MCARTGSGASRPDVVRAAERTVGAFTTGLIKPLDQTDCVMLRTVNGRFTRMVALPLDDVYVYRLSEVPETTLKVVEDPYGGVQISRKRPFQREMWTPQRVRLDNAKSKAYRLQLVRH